MNKEENLQCDLEFITEAYNRVKRSKFLFLWMLDDLLDVNDTLSSYREKYKNVKEFQKLNIQEMFLNDITEHLASFGYMVIKFQ